MVTLCKKIRGYRINIIGWKLLSVDSKWIVRWNGEHFKRKGPKWALGGSDGVCESDTIVVTLENHYDIIAVIA